MNQEQLKALIAQHTPKPWRKSEETKLLGKLMSTAKRFGAVLYRNNRGVYKKGNHWIAYGVGGNGGADLLGYRVVIVTPEMIGRKVAVFCAIEAKSATGRASDRQQEFIRQVNFDGGIAQVVRSERELETVLS